MRPRAAFGLVPLLALALAGCLGATEPLGPVAIPGGFLPALAMDQPTGGAEPNIAVLDENTIFITAVAGSQEQPNAVEGTSWLWRSTDAGATWETLRAPLRETPAGTSTLPMTRKPFGSSDADVVVSPDGWVYTPTGGTGARPSPARRGTAPTWWSAAPTAGRSGNPRR